MQKNLLPFLIFMVLFLPAWIWLQNTIWPPPPPKKPEEIAQQKKNDEAKKAPTRPQARWNSLTVDLKKTLLQIPSPDPYASLVGASAALTVQVRQAELTAPARTVVLGGKEKGHFIQALLTTRGAGVQQLILTKFEAANWLGRPAHTDLDLIPDDPEMASFLMYHFPDKHANNPEDTLGNMIWDVEEPTTDAKGVQEVQFSAKAPGLDHIRIVKTYRLEPGAYHLGLTLEIQNQSGAKGADPTWFRYQLSGAHGLPIEGEWYTSTFRQSMIGMLDARQNLYREVEDASRISHRGGGDRVPQGGLNDSSLQYAAVATQYFASAIVVDNQQAPSSEGGVDPKRVLAWARPTLETTEKAGRLRGLGKSEIVLESAGGRIEPFVLLPHTRKHIEELKLEAGQNVVVSFYEKSDGALVATWIRNGSTPRNFLDDITVRVHSTEMELPPGGKKVHRLLLYHGPVKPKLLGQFTGDLAVSPELVDRYSYELQLRTMTDYGKFSLWTDLLIACTNLMHWLLNILRFAGNGLSIILLTVIVRGMMFPISKKQAYFSIKMQELAPEMKKIQEKYKNDAKGKTEATMELYRKHNVHPLGGCLPIFLQMPIFIGLYYALQESIHFRLAPFLWIQNLAAPDMLVWWGEKIPFISDPDSQGSVFYLGPFLNLLPVIAVSLMIVQQKIMTPPAQDEQQEMQFKMMKYMMFFMGIMFYKVAAGLCMYFIASSAWGLAERQLLPKKKTVVVEPVLPTQARSGKSKKDRDKKDRDKPTEVDNSKIGKVKDWWQEVLRQAKKK